MDMKIILVNPRGFCAGVVMAIDSLEKALQLFGDPLYVYHEIVHNRAVVEQFTRRGVVFVNDLDEVPEGGTLMFSAHGVSPQLRTAAQRRHLRTIDATCPLVTKVHLEAVRYAREGYTILYIGHEGHDEVVGTLGEAPGYMRLIQTVADVAELDLPPTTKVAYLTQTTLSMDDVGTIVAELRQRYPQLAGPARDDICYATQNRQEALKALMPEADLAIVVGSQNSSNSMRLVEIACSWGKPAYRVDRAEEIADHWLTGAETVIITAGASAPEDAVQDCVGFLQRRYGATVESRTIRDEQVRFPLPRELRVLN